MVTKEQSLNKFLAKADEVINGKYLFALKKIEEMLATISTSKILFEVFEYCCRGEDCDGLIEKYLPDATSGGEVCMPENQKQIVALGFFALRTIADGDIDFNNFLVTRYPSGGTLLNSYELFISGFVVPFKKTVKFMVETIMTTPIGKGRRFDDSEKPSIDTQYLVGLTSFLEEDRRAVVNAATKDGAAKDMLYILDLFIESSKKSRITELKKLFIAYKYTSLHLKRIRMHRDDVEELLLDHGIIGK